MMQKTWQAYTAKLFSAIFTKPFIVDVWRHGCPNKPWVLNMPKF